MSARAGAGEGRPIVVAPALRVVDLTAVLGEELVLSRLSLDVPAGRTTVLLGPSGSGKTTLLRCMVGLGPAPRSGRIELDGRDLAALTPDDLRDFRRAAGVALGGALLYDSWTYGSESVAEQVTRTARFRGDTGDEVSSGVAHVLRGLDLADRAGLRPGQLAAHARRRLAIAMALVGRPRLIVLDDPETAFGLASRDRIVEIIGRTSARLGSTLVVATGDPDVARALGGRLAVLGRGRIIVQGEATALLDGVRDAGDLARRYPDGIALADPWDAGDAEPSIRHGHRTIQVDPYVLLWLMAILLALVATLAIGSLLVER